MQWSFTFVVVVVVTTVLSGYISLQYLAHNVYQPLYERLKQRLAHTVPLRVCLKKILGYLLQMIEMKSQLRKLYNNLILVRPFYVS